MRRLLSVDGGGIRGSLTACFLVELERQTGKPCREIFDFAAGTSTGALIAAAIAVGLPATEILKIYQEDAPKIFPLAPLEAWPFRIAQGHSSDSQKVIDTLVARFGKNAGWTLNDCPISVMFTAVRPNQKPLYFVRDNPKNSRLMGRLSLVDCAAASAAAPTYLTPVYVHPLGGTLVGPAVDGGVGGFANPTYRACVEAFYYDNFDPADTQVISLGTGFTVGSAVNFPSSLLGIVEFTLDSLLYNAGQEVTQMVDRHWPGIQTRMNWPLLVSVDMADSHAIPALVDFGQTLAAKVDWKSILKGTL